MILANCYYVTYHVVNFANNGTTTGHEDSYQNYDNALLVAKELIKCRDVPDSVCVVDGLTGEILDEFFSDDEWHRNNNSPKAAPKTKEAEVVEEEVIPTFKETFEDKNGGMWHLTDDGKWDYDCTGSNCSDCVYYENGGCEVSDPLCEEDRNYLIERAKERIAEANNPITNKNLFEDGLGGTWRRDDEEPELWSYDCGGVHCDDCPYNWGAGPCYTDRMHISDVKDLIAETKERMGR